MKKGAIIPGHVGGRHLSPPPPQRAPEDDGEEAVINESAEDEDDIYTDDDNREVNKTVPSTEPVAHVMETEPPLDPDVSGDTTGVEASPDVHGVEEHAA